MSQHDHDEIQAGVMRRLAAVEPLIPAKGTWRSVADDRRPGVVRVVAGPTLRGGPTAARPARLILALTAITVLLFAYGLMVGGGQPSPPTSASPSTTPAAATNEPTPVGILRPGVEPRLLIPLRPASEWTLVDDTEGHLELAHFLDSVGDRGYNVGVTVLEPRAVYDPVVETRRLPLPDDLIAWIADHPDLDADEPEELAVAGLSATSIDVTVTYPSNGPKGQTAQFIDAFHGSWNLESPTRMRLVLLDLPDRPLLIAFSSRPEFFDDSVGQFEALLRSVKFEERGPSP
jgi:hypothetical protein